MDIAGMLKEAVGDKITSELGISEDKVDGIVSTVSDTVGGGEGSDLGGMASKLVGGLLGGDDKGSDIGATLIQSLVTKNGLTDDLAGKVKDLLLPLAMDFVKDQAGDKLSGLMGKFKF